MEITQYYQQTGGGLERNNEYLGPGHFMGAESIKNRALKKLYKRFKKRHTRERKKVVAPIRVKKKAEMMGAFDFSSLSETIGNAVGSFTKGASAASHNQVLLTPQGIQYNTLPVQPAGPIPQSTSPDYMKYIPIAIPLALIAYKLYKSRR